MGTVTKIRETPEWLPADDWADFLAFRVEIKAPMGPVAQKRALTKLAKFHAEGYDVSQIIDNSIEGRWKGLFAYEKEVARNWQEYADTNGIEAKIGETWPAYKHRVETIMRNKS